MRRWAVVLALPLAVWACEGTAGGPALTDLTMTLAPASSRQPGTAALLGGPIPLSAVSAISVTVTGVQARHESPQDPGGAWFDLAIEGGSKTIDLTDLPGAGLVLANGSLPSGSYTDARLFFDPGSATITLSEEVCLGVEGQAAAETCLTAGPHDLFVPSGMDTGIKTGAQFTLDEGAETVMLVFDADATVQTLAWGPTMEVVVMNPVIRAAVEAGE